MDYDFPLEEESEEMKSVLSYYMVHHGDSVSSSDEGETLEIPSTRNLDRILQQVRKLEKRVSSVISPLFFEKLSDTFEDFEDLETFEEIGKIREILLLIIKVGNIQILDSLIKVREFKNILGALEYYPGADELSKLPLRDAFKQRVCLLKEVDRESRLAHLQEKIQTVSRLEFVLDVMEKNLNDHTIINIKTLIHFNKYELQSEIISCPGFFQELFPKLNASQTQKDAVDFLWELFQIIQNNVEAEKRLKDSSRLLDLNVLTAFLHSLKASCLQKQQGSLDVMQKCLRMMNLLIIWHAEKVGGFVFAHLEDFFTCLACCSSFLNLSVQKEIGDLVISLCPQLKANEEAFQGLLKLYVLPLLCDVESITESSPQVLQDFDKSTALQEFLQLLGSLKQLFPSLEEVESKLEPALLRMIRLNNKSITLHAVKFLQTLWIGKSDYLLRFIKILWEVASASRNPNNMLVGILTKMFWESSSLNRSPSPPAYFKAAFSAIVREACGLKHSNSLENKEKKEAAIHRELESLFAEDYPKPEAISKRNFSDLESREALFEAAVEKRIKIL